MKNTKKRLSDIPLEQFYFGPLSDRSRENLSHLTQRQVDSLFTFPTMAALTGRIGISRNLLQWAKNKGCGAFHPSGRVCLTKLTRWIQDYAYIIGMQALNSGLRIEISTDGPMLMREEPEVPESEQHTPPATPE